MKTIVVFSIRIVVDCEVVMVPCENVPVFHSLIYEPELVNKYN